MSTATNVNVLTPPLTDQNVRAFVAPLIAAGRELVDCGINVRLHYRIEPSLADCDVLVLNSSFWRGPWLDRRAEALLAIADLGERVQRLLFFDRSSTSGTVLADVLPLVARYYKTNLLRDRSLYQRPLYGLRAFTDYYHREFGIVDEPPFLSPVVEDADELAKLRVSWSTALANYSLLGPRLSALYRHLPIARLMRPSCRFEETDTTRHVALSCRMGLSYRHRSVGFQRQRMAELLSDYRRTDRIGKLAYVRELRNSRIVTSPFGYSEVNYKDFETFLAGAALLKPDMSHLDTYPELYEDGITYVSHRWDFSDLREKIDRLLHDDSQRLAIAAAGQQRYRQATVGRSARESFAGYFRELLHESDRPLQPESASCSIGNASSSR